MAEVEKPAAVEEDSLPELFSSLELHQEGN